ncbi:biotin-dependent carboxyltransferase family protein [Vulgatibacter incomptus]|uniref:Allophanate hydrolase 2 subunit 2 n=1 Tax=Vulgatibacter incomptus TaxID=1391653 RepID=A0A0K1PI31_9BACT|nr:biotin-dependent carboxyltransferase family protein [Vulgatibacter incomptus]AKU92754.1 Allophanate hydrolase 2 subunit 2 [Vulgatibacter incomptus]
MSEQAGHLEIVSVSGLATVQDAGRLGFMDQGVPPGGALCTERLARANRAVGNAPGAAVIEAFGPLVVTARGGPLTLFANGSVVRMKADEEVRLGKPPGERIIHVAVAGGFDVPVHLGGRGTLLVARLGGLDGRALRRGDRLPIGAADRLAKAEVLPEPPHEGSIRVIVGPDHFSAEALEVLQRATFLVSPSSDRVGMRLDGPPIPRTGGDEGRSLPMVRGAIQVPASGAPIVLGPDHPTTGGYPVIATVIRADLGRIEGRPARTEVRFSVVTLEQSREAYRATSRLYFGC